MGLEAPDMMRARRGDLTGPATGSGKTAIQRTYIGFDEEDDESTSSEDGKEQGLWEEVLRSKQSLLVPAMSTENGHALPCQMITHELAMQMS